MMSNPMMAAGNLAQAQADALRTAAGNQGGAMAGFMGMGMAGMAGGLNANDLFAQGMQMQKDMQAQKPQQSVQSAVDSWTCTCGVVNTGEFCVECGAKKPADGWTCACGAVNKGKFCPECGAKKPVDAPLYQCDKCGWQPEDPKNPPRFCPECGDKFDENDIK
jgi:membrane protease subunit (stomatin/prohibitin family)